jgi:hypothetical protein
MSYADWIGTTGVFLILLAFVFNSFKILSADSISYLLLNAIGAGLACYASWLIRYWPFVILEGSWMVVSLVALIRTGTKANRRSRQEN